MVIATLGETWKAGTADNSGRERGSCRWVVRFSASSSGLPAGLWLLGPELLFPV